MASSNHKGCGGVLENGFLLLLLLANLDNYHPNNHDGCNYGESHKEQHILCKTTHRLTFLLVRCFGFATALNCRSRLLNFWHLMPCESPVLPLLVETNQFLSPRRRRIDAKQTSDSIANHSESYGKGGVYLVPTISSHEQKSHYRSAQEADIFALLHLVLLLAFHLQCRPMKPSS